MSKIQLELIESEEETLLKKKIKESTGKNCRLTPIIITNNYNSDDGGDQTELNHSQEEEQDKETLYYGKFYLCGNIYESGESNKRELRITTYDLIKGTYHILYQRKLSGCYDREYINEYTGKMLFNYCLIYGNAHTTFEGYRIQLLNNK